MNVTNFRRGMQTMSMYEKQEHRKDIPTTYMETLQADERRKHLLSDARLLSPIDMVLRVDKLQNTVLFPLFKHPVTWIVAGTYTLSAVASRMKWIDLPDANGDSFEGAGTMVTFMVVFYVGYCYSRFTSMFTDLEEVMRGVINCYAVARLGA